MGHATAVPDSSLPSQRRLGPRGPRPDGAYQAGGGGAKAPGARGRDGGVEAGNGGVILWPNGQDIGLTIV